MMPAIIETPVDLVEAIADLRFPPKTDGLMQALMDRNNDGALTPAEREELEALVELSEMMALVRARALKVLGRNPA
jgi:hypothetical protein